MLSAFLLAMGMLCIYGKINIRIQHYNAVCMLPAHCMHTAVSMPHSQDTALQCSLHAAVSMPHSQDTALQCCLHAACMLLCIYEALNHIDLDALYIDLNVVDMKLDASQHSVDAYKVNHFILLEQNKLVSLIDIINLIALPQFELCVTLKALSEFV